MPDSLELNYTHLLDNNFDDKTILRGYDYFEQGKVISMDAIADGALLRSLVEGSSHRKRYNTLIAIDWKKEHVDGHCSCPVGHNCKHVVATLLEQKHAEMQLTPRSLDKQNSAQKHTKSVTQTELSKTDPDTQFESWFRQFNRDIGDTKASAHPITAEQNLTLSQNKEQLFYVLDTAPYCDHELFVDLKLSRTLKNGGYGKLQDFRLSNVKQQKHLQAEDMRAISALQLMIQMAGGSLTREQGIPLAEQNSTKCLETIIETGRCVWKNPNSPPLMLGKAKKPQFSWEVREDAHQHFNIHLNEKPAKVMILEHAWYIDLEENECGPLNTEVPPKLLNNLLRAPKIPPQAVSRVRQSLKAWSQVESLLPQILKTKRVQPPKRITPELHLDYQIISVPRHLYTELSRHSKAVSYWHHGDETSQIEVPTAEILFDYGGKLIPYSSVNTEKATTFFKNGQVQILDRDLAQEKRLVSKLKKHDIFANANILSNVSPTRDTLVLPNLQTDAACLEFSLNTLSDLEATGWKVVRIDNTFVELVQDTDLEWYSELEDTSEYDYFSFRLGIVVEGEPIDILPLVTRLISTSSTKKLSMLADNERVTLPLDSGKMLAIPFSRIKPIVNILFELYDTELTKGGLKINKHQATLLADIEKAFQTSQMRWMGGDKLLSLSQHLANFSNAPSRKAPKTFKATLRGYQQSGVNWLQFLREHQLGGILADDMGLGKTIQTLAHLCIEKNRGRLTKPCLIVAPTSLMHNWQSETSRFAPHLKTLVFHGDDRHSKSEKISQCHLVFTTYPLILRDKKIFLAHQFYYLILDEAQFIKNHKARSTQIIHQIQAEHRLCLTGTPMENHLLELWSLFHFLMPGFLGKLEQFKKVFKTPIEKQNDLLKQQGLAQRIKPFLLRRTKQEVLKDLPEKTEIIHKITLEGPQRDLYESIRLSMEEKVKNIVAQKGLKRSHLIILDALLKLRQTCCDPKLLSLSSAEKAHGHSAKLDALMQMLPSMVEEGQKILVFSQFTKMLKLIEEQLNQAQLEYVKLTGATKRRDKAIRAFQEGNTPIFLISLKAGGTGLNLTAADTVIHYDPWWNPAVENQATDRAHRMGQKKPVMVYKLLTADTVEETIHEMQQKKRALMEGLFTDGETSKIDLSEEDLATLFTPI